MNTSRTISMGTFNPDLHAAAHPFVKMVGEVCGECGFASITDHGIPEELLQRAYQCVKSLFQFSDEWLHERYFNEKFACQRGYVPFETEKAAGATQKDKKRFFMFPVRNPEDLWKGLWPRAEVQDLEECLSELALHLEEFMNRMLGAVELYAGVPRGSLRNACKKTSHFIRPICYPAGALPGSVRAGAHTDIGAGTAIPCACLDDDLSKEPRWTGLSAQCGDGSWMKIMEVPGSITWNLADHTVALARHLGATCPLVSAKHKVEVTEELSKFTRLVIVYFHQMHGDVIVGKKVDGSEKTATEFLLERLSDIDNGVPASLQERITLVETMQKKADLGF